MYALNLPNFEINTKEKNGKLAIFDFLRRRYIILTPEEWVRQHFTHFLVDKLNYPKSLMQNEVKLNLNGTIRRCDTIVYSSLGRPIMIIEYKAPNIKITQNVFEQITSYNIILRVPFLIVSNGLNHYCCKIDYENRSYEFIQEIPRYTQISAIEKD